MNIEKTELIGIALPFKTTNENGQSAIDCGSLWQKFGNEQIAERIPGKLNNSVYAVYHDYEGDHTKPYSYFIGCKVEPGTGLPEGMERLTIGGTKYVKLTATGKIPECIANAWVNIWKSDLKRAYQTDFEVYDERSANWEAGEVDIYLSVPL